jgi:hypothetical protein
VTEKQAAARRKLPAQRWSRTPNPPAPAPARPRRRPERPDRLGDQRGRAAGRAGIPTTQPCGGHHRRRERRADGGHQRRQSTQQHAVAADLGLPVRSAVLDVRGQRKPDRVGQPLPDQPVQELVRAAGGVGAHHHPPAWACSRPVRRQRSQRLPGHRDVIGGVFDPAFPARSSTDGGSPVPSAPWSTNVPQGESAWGAVSVFPPVRSPRPLTEPAVRLWMQRARHGHCRCRVWTQGLGIAGSTPLSVVGGL